MRIEPEYATCYSIDTMEEKRILTGCTIIGDDGIVGVPVCEELSNLIDREKEKARMLNEGLKCDMSGIIYDKANTKTMSYKEYVTNDIESTKDLSNFINNEEEKAKMQYNEIVSSYSKASILKKGEVIFPEIKKVHFSGPCTVVIWEDGTKTMVRCQEGDKFDPEKGLAMAIAKKALGNKGRYFDEIKRHMPLISPSEVCKEHLGAWSSLFQFTTVQDTITSLEKAVDQLKKEIEERE